MWLATACLLLSFCGTDTAPTLTPTTTLSTTPSASAREFVTKTVTPSETPHPLSVSISATPSLLPSAPSAPPLDPSDWKSWPIIPTVIDPSLSKVYELGLSLGNDPRAFSIFGDSRHAPVNSSASLKQTMQLSKVSRQSYKRQSLISTVRSIANHPPHRMAQPPAL